MTGAKYKSGIKHNANVANQSRQDHFMCYCPCNQVLECAAICGIQFAFGVLLAD